MKELPFREEVYAGGRTDAALLDNLLQVEGLDTIVALDKRFARLGRESASVFVLDPAHVQRARDIVERYQRREPLKDPKSYRSWRCRACNELVEGQFEACWKCGASRPLGHPAPYDRPAAESTAERPLQPSTPARDALVMLVFLLAALLLTFASSARRRVGQVPQRMLSISGQR